MPHSPKSPPTSGQTMRVALLHPLNVRQFGGEEYLQQWRQAVNRAGVDVLTPLQGQRALTSLKEARRWVRERDWSKVDVVHAEMLPGASSAFYVLLALAELPNRPALSVAPHASASVFWQVLSWRIRLWSWSGLSSSPLTMQSVASRISSAKMFWSERWLARRLDGLVAHSPSMAQEGVRGLGLPAGRIHVIPRGAMAMPVTPLPDDSVLRLIYVGASSVGDDVRTLIAAMAEVLRARPEQVGRIRLTLAGDYADTVGAVDELVQLIADSQLTGLIDMQHDVSPSEIQALIQRHHLLVLPGAPAGKLGLVREVFQTKVALSWSIGSGRGVLASGGGALAEQLPSGAGLVLESGGRRNLASALEGLLLAPEPLAQWARAAASAAPLADWERIGYALYGHFQLLKDRRAKGRVRA